MNLLLSMLEDALDLKATPLSRCICECCYSSCYALPVLRDAQITQKTAAEADKEK